MNKMGVTWQYVIVIADDKNSLVTVAGQGVRENIVMDTEDRENHSEILLNGSFFPLQQYSV